MLLLREKVARYRGDTSKINQIQQMKNYMIRKGYSPKTIQTYVNHIQHLNRELDNNITPERIDGYLILLLREKKLSHTYVNQMINAVKIYSKFRFKLNAERFHPYIRPKTELMLAYSCGLRVSEVANLKIRDIDSDRMVVIIRHKKSLYISFIKAFLCNTFIGKWREPSKYTAASRSQKLTHNRTIYPCLDTRNPKDHKSS